MPDTWNDPYATAAPASAYPTKKASNAAEQVLGLYQQNFGRSASGAEADHWVNWAGGGSYLAPDQLNRINTQFQQEPEYKQYQGVRPQMSVGDYIPGVTLGTSLQSDAAWRTQPNMGGGLQAEQETTNADFQKQIRERLLGLMNQPAPTAQDPSLAPAISAFNAAQNKATTRQVNQNAEAFGASGLESSGARLGADNAAIEQQGLNEGQFASNAILSQYDRQRQELMQALQTATAINDQDLSRRLQERLGQLNAAIQREGLAQSGKLGQADLDLRGMLGRGQLNLNLLGLMQQGQQYNTSMGFNVAQLEAALNNQAVRTALGL